MNTVRKLFGCLFLMAVALPASAAPAKIYSINAGSIGPSVDITIKNETPSGNSTINSFIICTPVSVSSGSAPGATVNVQSGAAPCPSGTVNNVYVNNFSGLKAGLRTPYQLKVTLSATYPTASCGATYTWKAVVYAGNAFGQETFDPVVGDPPTNPTQTVACTYSLTNLSATSFPAGATTAITGTLANTSPAGGPSIDSIQLTGPSGISSAAVTVSPALAPGATPITVNFSVAATCGAANGALGSVALAGTQALTRDNTLPNETVTPKCSLAVTTPQNVIAGTAFDVKVTAKDGNGNAIGTFDTTIDLASTPSGVTKNGQSATGGTVTVNATLGQTGGYVLTASGTFGGANLSASTGSFTAFASGPLNCEPTTPYTYGNDSAGGSRGMFNKDGSPCQVVSYTFTDNVATNNSVLLTWDTTAQPNAAFETAVQWQPELVGATGLPTKKTYVAWTFTGTTPNKVVARACIDSMLPTPYGTLSNFVSPDVIAIDTTSPSGARALPTTYPYAIFIGGPKVGDPNTYVVERLHVTGTATGGYKVIRGAGGTNQVNLSNVVGAAKVMSNPLPLDSSSNQMQMCIAQETWDSLKPGTAGCPAISGGDPVACVRYTTTIFDIGDGFVGRDF